LTAFTALLSSAGYCGRSRYSATWYFLRKPSLADVRPAGLWGKPERYPPANLGLSLSGEEL